MQGLMLQCARRQRHTGAVTAAQQFVSLFDQSIICAILLLVQTADGEQKIVPGSEVRLRIVGTRVDASDIVSGDSLLGRASMLRDACKLYLLGSVCASI